MSSRVVRSLGRRAFFRLGRLAVWGTWLFGALSGLVCLGSAQQIGLPQPGLGDHCSCSPWHVWGAMQMAWGGTDGGGCMGFLYHFVFARSRKLESEVAV